MSNFGWDLGDSWKRLVLTHGKFTTATHSNCCVQMVVTKCKYFSAAMAGTSAQWVHTSKNLVFTQWARAKSTKKWGVPPP